MQYAVRELSPESNERITRFRVMPLTTSNGDLTKVRLDTITFTQAIYNITPNNNFIRFLRRLDYIDPQSDEYRKTILSDIYPSRLQPIQSAFTNNSTKIGDDVWVLCALWIDPGIYTTVDEIGETLNRNLIESVRALFNGIELYSDVSIANDDVRGLLFDRFYFQVYNDYINNLSKNAWETTMDGTLIVSSTLITESPVHAIYTKPTITGTISNAWAGTFRGTIDEYAGKITGTYNGNSRSGTFSGTVRFEDVSLGRRNVYVKGTVVVTDGPTVDFSATCEESRNPVVDDTTTKPAPTPLVSVESITNTSLTLKFNFDCIPVTTSNEVACQQIVLTDIPETPYTYENFATKKMNKLITYTNGSITISSNTSFVNSYIDKYNTVNNKFSQFTQETQCLYDMLGVQPYVIEWLDTNVPHIRENDFDKCHVREDMLPAYLVKGYYYAECLYTGPITVQSRMFLPSARDIPIDKRIIDPGFDVKRIIANDEKYNTNTFNDVFNTRVIRSKYRPSFSNVRDLKIMLSQIEDIETILNLREPSKLNISLVDIDLDKDDSAMPRTYEIGREITIPTEGINVYVTSSTSRYALMNEVSNTRLTVEYIG